MAWMAQFDLKIYQYRTIFDEHILPIALEDPESCLKLQRVPDEKIRKALKRKEKGRLHLANFFIHVPDHMQPMHKLGQKIFETVFRMKQSHYTLTKLEIPVMDLHIDNLSTLAMEAFRTKIKCFSYGLRTWRAAVHDGISESTWFNENFPGVEFDGLVVKVQFWFEHTQKKSSSVEMTKYWKYSWFLF